MSTVFGRWKVDKRLASNLGGKKPKSIDMQRSVPVQIWLIKPMESQDLKVEGVCEGEDWKQEWIEWSVQGAVRVS